MCAEHVNMTSHFAKSLGSRPYQRAQTQLDNLLSNKGILKTALIKYSPFEHFVDSMLCSKHLRRADSNSWPSQKG